MSEGEPTPIERFNTLWSAATLGEELSIDANYENRREIPLEDGVAEVRVKLLPTAVGSLRPRIKLLQVITPSGRVASLSDGQVIYGVDAEIIQNLSIVEDVLSPKK